MRTSKYLLSTLKEIPSNTEAISHKLMLRAGMIRKLASGIYTWLPTGLRILHNVEYIIREEMINIGALEISMPIVQPENIWKNSGRLLEYGPELLKFTDRNVRKFVLGPTNEEVITYLVRNELVSYKQLPITFFQIQTKFRDEVRPRFGVMRSREFIMKDAYSLHTNETSLKTTYEIMYQAYNIIFKRIGLNFRVVQADTGYIGGKISHEFHVLANSGENDIVFSTCSDYAENINIAEATKINNNSSTEPIEKMRIVETYGIKNISDLNKKFNIPIEKTVNIFIVLACKGAYNPLVALMLRGDHNLNILKAEKLQQVAVPLKFASEKDINLTIGIGLGSLGPVNLPVPLIIDRSVATMSNFIAGANIEGKYFFGINWHRDLPLPMVADLRNVVNGDISPDGHGKIKIKRGIEVGHIFQIGTKYSNKLKAMVQDKKSITKPLIMGCYGIGITRLVAAVIEQNNDDRGILWPESIAPFNVAILPMNMHKSFRVKEVTESIYTKISTYGIQVLLDDRKERPGVMFADIEIIGIPHIIIISDRHLDTDDIEYKNRRSGKTKLIKLNAIVDFIVNKSKNFKKIL